MSSFSSHPRITSSSVDHLATSIKLSYCYLTFYIVQILMAGSLCFMLFLDYLELIPFVEVPIAFFIMFDMYFFVFILGYSATMLKLRENVGLKFKLSTSWC